MMKRIKIIANIVLIMFFALCSLVAQNKAGEYQNFLANARVLLDKETEIFTNDDLIELNGLIKMDINQFGEENAKLCKNIVEQAKKKKNDYEQYVERMRNMSATLDTLDSEINRREELEIEYAELMSENIYLKKIIEELNSVIVQIKNQEKKLQNANARLQKENLAANNLLKESSDIVAQMLKLIPEISNDVADELPRTLIDSLEDAQCGMAQLLKTNFLITIQQLKINQPFMDSASTFYNTNHNHLPDVKEYMSNSEELVNRLRNSGIDCALKYANDIEVEMLDFINSIENSPAEINNFIQFVKNNIYWIIPVCLILIVGIVVLVRNTSKKAKDDN